MSETSGAKPQPHRAIRSALIITDDLRRFARLTVFFRLLLVIPHLIWLAIWGIAVYFAVIIAWFAALFTGRVPEGIHNFNSSYLRYLTRVSGYYFLLANPFPPPSRSRPRSPTRSMPTSKGRSRRAV